MWQLRELRQLLVTDARASRRLTGFALRVLRDTDWGRSLASPIDPDDVRLLRDATRPTPTLRRYPRFPAWQIDLTGRSGRGEPTGTSERRFGSTPLDDDQLQGVIGAVAPWSSEGGIKHPVPSAGAIRGCRAYLLPLRVDGLEAAIHHLDPSSGVIEKMWPVVPADVDFLFPGQPWVASSGLLWFFVVDLSAYEGVYENRGLRFAILEAGQYAQAVWRCLEAVGLGGCVIGGFDDAAVSDLLDLRGEERALVAVSCGNREST